MDIVEKLRRIADSCSPFPPPTDMMFDAANEIERLRIALQAVVDAHGTGQGIGAQGVGSWLDQARQALEK